MRFASAFACQRCGAVAAPGASDGGLASLVSVLTRAPASSQCAFFIGGLYSRQNGLRSRAAADTRSPSRCPLP
jgi:hypothetical protein